MLFLKVHSQYSSRHRTKNYIRYGPSDIVHLPSAPRLIFMEMSIVNYTADEINSTVQTTKFSLLPAPTILLFGYLNWVEAALALLGLIINSYVMMAVLLGNTRASRGYFFGLLNLSLAQSFISVISIFSVTVPLFDSRNNLTSPLVGK